MTNPVTALTTAIEDSTKVANTPLFSTVIDKLLGFKISEWGAQGDAIKKQILDGYEEAKQRGLGFQYVSAFRSNANLINIGRKATKYIAPNRRSNIAMDNDVFWGFLEHAKEISNEEMQEIIAKIIAGEYNNPGTYSMSTLQVVKMLGKNELKLFERISCLLIDGERLPQELFSGRKSVKDLMNEVGLDFGSLQILQTLGLFLPNGMKQIITVVEKTNFTVKYFDKELIYVPKNESFGNVELPNFYGLSIVGKQIVKHLTLKYVEKFYFWLKQNYKISNYELQSDSL